MIETIEQPKELKHLPEDYWYISTGNGSGPIAYLGIQRIDRENVGIHMQVLRWSHNALKVLKADWQELVEILYHDGARYLIASNDDIGDTRWPKFIKHFGFPRPKITKYSKQEINHG